VARARVTLAAGETRSLRLRLRGALRRDLRRHSHRTVRLRAFTGTGEGAVFADRRTVVLRR
jgi:hypothetical protein